MISNQTKKISVHLPDNSVKYVECKPNWTVNNLKTEIAELIKANGF